MVAAEDGPDEAVDLGLELHPVCRVSPRAGNALRRDQPVLAAILAAEEPDVCGGDEVATRVEWVDVITVASGDVLTTRLYAAVTLDVRIACEPVLAAVRAEKPRRLQTHHT